jgi:Phage portal protein, SPP1 Gp6-like
MDADEMGGLEVLRQAAARKLNEQAARARTFQTYYEGEQDIPVLMDSEERRVFRAFLEESEANWCELVVNAVAERLEVTGFRFAGEPDLPWQIWQASQMDADAELVQTDALVTGSGFVLVQPDDDNPTGVAISPESPEEATVLYEPGNRRRRRAGYKRFTADDDTQVQVLILPDVIVTWYGNDGPVLDGNPAGEVGLIQVVPQPRTSRPPRSELTPALPIQDRINTTIFNRMVSADYGAFRQIWATGVKIARQVIAESGGGPDGEDAVTRLVKPFDVGANRLLANENPNGRFGSFPESTLRGYLDAAEQDVNMLAAITQTPPHYLLGQIVNLAADAIKAAEAGLVAKCRRRARHMGEDWEEAMRTALRITGSPAAADVSAEVIWADFETRSEGQRVDALVKMATLDVPVQVLWEKWGASPQEITRWQALQATEAATTAASAAASLASPDAAYARLLAASGAGAPPPAAGQ